MGTNICILSLLSNTGKKICPHTLYQHEYSFLQDWTEFVHETWRSVPEVGEFASISKSLTNSDGYFVIDSLDVLEAALVLASNGHIETIEKLVIKHVDMKNIPINIINSLNKIVRSSLELELSGWFRFKPFDVR